MRIARQDERADPERVIGTQLRRDLRGIADDRHAHAAAREADARPELRFDDEGWRCREHLLAALSFAVYGRARLDEAASHCRINPADQPFGRLPRLVLRLAHDDVA